MGRVSGAGRMPVECRRPDSAVRLAAPSGQPQPLTRPHRSAPAKDGATDVSARDFSAVPAATGLYDPANEHDACGVAMVATLRGNAGHDIVEQALVALRNLDQMCIRDRPQGRRRVQL